MLGLRRTLVDARCDGGLPYTALAETLQEVEAEPARIKSVALMTDLVCRTLRDSPNELLSCVALTTMQLAPAARPLKLGIADALVLQALEAASGERVDALKSELRERGDVGELAAAVMGRADTSAHDAPLGESGTQLDGTAGAPATRLALSVGEVHSALLELAAQEGAGSTGRKIALLGDLLRRTTPLEATYIVRSSERIAAATAHRAPVEPAPCRSQRRIGRAPLAPAPPSLARSLA